MPQIAPALIIATVTAVAAGLTACESIDTPMDDGYQFGDLSRTVVQLRRDYCIHAEGSAARAVALRALQTRGAPIPSDGVCTRLLGDPAADRVSQ